MDTFHHVCLVSDRLKFKQTQITTVSLTQHECGPAGYPSLQALVEDLVEEHDGLANEIKQKNSVH